MRKPLMFLLFLLALLVLAMPAFAQTTTTTTTLQHSVTLNWTASADVSSTNPVTYNVLRAAAISGSCTGVAYTSLATGLTTTTYKDTTVVGGTTYCYEVEAEGSNSAVSVNNPTVAAAVPPFPVTGLTQTSQ